MVKDPKQESAEKLIICIQEKAGYGETKMTVCSQRLEKLCHAELDITRSAMKTRQILQIFEEICSVTKELVLLELVPIKEIIKDNVQHGICVQQAQKHNKDKEPQKISHRRSTASYFNKDCCIICQKEGGKTNKVAYLTTDPKVLAQAQKLKDDSLFLQLNEIPNAEDAAANDVQYHRTCWVFS